MKNLIKLLLLLLAAFTGIVFNTAAGDFISVDEKQLAQLAVQERGRKKPMTTLMEESLLALTGSRSFLPPGAKLRQSASSVMLGVWLEPKQWADKPLILISHRPLLDKIGLPREQKLFSYTEVTANAALQALIMEAQRLRARDPQAELNSILQEAQTVARRQELFKDWTSGKIIAIVPHPVSPSGAWLTLPDAGQYYPREKLADVYRSFTALQSAFQTRDAAAFNAALREMTIHLYSLPEPRDGADVYPATKALLFEYHYHQFHPFRWAWISYTLGVLSLLVTSAWMTRPGYKLGWALVLLGFALQVYGFYCRVVISGRPPVTNMYETVIWVAFGTVLFAIILEAIYKCRYFLLAACPVAILSLILADTQPTVLDSSIHPLVPVLRHNVWLIVHVLTITLSYAAFALALGLGQIVLGKAIVRNLPQKDSILYLYLYRALQIGVLLLATGTILGGVWANYSWGRFWDWDPKETWALTALLCYLALLHGRLTGWWGGFGLAVGSVICFQAVLMAWYGVNFVLGKGLHSYGFGTGGYSFAVAFVAAELAFVALALWRHRSLGAVASPVTKNKKSETLSV